MKILTVLGARPQFIKAATVSRALAARNNIEEFIVHTGQHFDKNMSEVFFNELNIPAPRKNLGISSLSHGGMTGRMLESLEKIIQEEQPDWVLVYGDTNSTLAGALAAAKLQVPLAHVEAGLRSHNLAMPEEINRILTDRVSNLLLCPTDTAVRNLIKEGFPFSNSEKSKQKIVDVGDVMFDATLYYRGLAKEKIKLESFGLQENTYALCTLHRQENTDDASRLTNILSALRQIASELPVFLPIHPRTKTKLMQAGLSDDLKGIMVRDPLSYLEMQRLEMGARLILTDSGGVQKEAYFHQVPCITLRDETEWIETVTAGANCLAGASEAGISKAFEEAKNKVVKQRPFYGDGNTANRIVDLLVNLS